MICKKFTAKQSGCQPILMGKGSYVQLKTALIKTCCNIAAERVFILPAPC
jgi:hypothetical protein